MTMGVTIVRGSAQALCLMCRLAAPRPCGTIRVALPS